MVYNRLFRKFADTLHNYGPGEAVRRTVFYLKENKKILSRIINNRQVYKNTGEVLFINGCSVEHPARYRVFHQLEQLRLSGIAAEQIYYEDIGEELAERYQKFIIFRCMYTDYVKEFVDKVHSLGKTVIFDIDDLVIDTEYTDALLFVQEFPPARKRAWDKNVLLMRETLLASDAVISTTKELSGILEGLLPASYIWRNMASQEMVSVSVKEEKRYRKKDDCIRIGYFSGSPTHNEDFRMIVPALRKILEEFQNTKLVLVGSLREIPELSGYTDRIEFRKHVSYSKLSSLIASVDINLAPLCDTVFNRCKSEIKWIEAGLVHVPTAASNTGAYKEMIRDGITGVLCENDPESWYHGLKKMILDHGLRSYVGNNAFHFIMENCTTEAGSRGYRELISRIGRTGDTNEQA